MTLISKLQKIPFEKQYASRDGVYRFIVTELYPGLAPVNYKFVVGDWRCSFAKNKDGFYNLQFADNPFDALEEKAAFVGCDLEIYPAFSEEEKP